MKALLSTVACWQLALSVLFQGTALEATERSLGNASLREAAASSNSSIAELQRSQKSPISVLTSIVLQLMVLLKTMPDASMQIPSKDVGALAGAVADLLAVFPSAPGNPSRPLRELQEAQPLNTLELLSDPERASEGEDYGTEGLEFPETAALLPNTALQELSLQEQASNVHAEQSVGNVPGGLGEVASSESPLKTPFRDVAPEAPSVVAAAGAPDSLEKDSSEIAEKERANNNSANSLLSIKTSFSFVAALFFLLFFF